MLPHTPRGGVRRLATFLAVLTAAITLPLVSACDKVPLLAPAGTVITIFPASTTLSSSGEVEIIATVIERGQASSGTGTGATQTPAAGTPVHNGTVVSFTSNIGRIEPREARTHNGEVRVKFFADGANGTAIITAYSGGASARLENLLVGSAATERLVLTANSSNGATQIIARAETTSGAPLAGVPVTFSTNSGSVSPTSAVTDANGEARTTLASGSTATVKATAGAKSAEIVVNRSGLAVTASPTTPNVGQPVSFSITTASGQAATNVRINFGDGSPSRNLGTVTGTRSETYTYSRTGNFQVSVIADNAENTGTSVSVGAPDITLAATPNPTLVGNPTTFTATVPAGTQVERYTFTYDDGTVRTGTSRVDSHVFSSRGSHTGRVDVVGVGGVLLGSASASVVIQ